MNLRTLAAGKPCQIRVPGFCNGDPATTVLAHYRLSGVSGMGIKAPDICGAWSCSGCHDIVDRRRGTITFDYTEVSLMHSEGVIRTLNELHKLGVFDDDSK